MPDHIHLILRVTAPFVKGSHLGKVVYGFKVGCSRVWWRISRQASGGQTPETVAPASTGTADQHKNHLPLLFEEGYNDRILMDDGQLDRWKNYLADNPRRLWTKRQYPHYFTVVHDISINGLQCHAVGNRFLLDVPDKRAVIVHSSDSDECYQSNFDMCMGCGERGGVLMSAAISPREKAIMREAMNRGDTIIYIRDNGFPKLYKPAGESFDACAAGRLLQISPNDYRHNRQPLTRPECLRLNSLARAIVNGS